jgi:hypothetical protein
LRNDQRTVARNDASTIETGSSATITFGRNKRARHHHALALAARELAREAAEDLFRL